VIDLLKKQVKKPDARGDKSGGEQLAGLRPSLAPRRVEEKCAAKKRGREKGYSRKRVPRKYPQKQRKNVAKRPHS